ncbi:hypothetical protein GC173_06725 [bacterium]|nr:hypothetical protein [bacterium]
MFLKLTENETLTDVYLNPDHIVRFIPNPAAEGTLIFMSADAGLAPRGEMQLLVVHEHAEEVFRMISRQEKPGKGGVGGRGLI